MISFDKILQSRGLDKCPTPLWKLKITDHEYAELKELLGYRTHLYYAPEENRFHKCARECAIFYSEFWRREYQEGSHSMQIVYDAIKPQQYVEKGAKDFYDAAVRGAKQLGIEWYEDERTQYLDSMLYQGGLPMKLVTSSRQNSVWDRFTRGLVNRRINFDELNLGIVATNSKALKEYCEQLIRAIEAEQYMLMPFYCENQSDHWYAYLIDLAKKERKRFRIVRPFTIDWEFAIDAVAKKLVIKYVAEGEQELTTIFTGKYQLPNSDFFSIQMRVNGKATESFDYLKNYCRYAVKSKHTYHNGDRVSIHLSDCDAELVADELDLSSPHILYRNIKGDFVLGNHMGYNESFLLIPQGWEVTSELKNLEQAQYDWDGELITGIRIPTTYRDQITVKSREGSLAFGANIPLLWTELKGAPIFMPNVDRMLYDVSKCKFTLCSDVDDVFTEPRIMPNIEFRNKWQTEWQDTPSYGEIVARVKTRGYFITPTNKFINIGKGFTFTVLNADERTCQVKVDWPHGHVVVKEGVKKVNDVWQIKRDDTTDNKLHLTFIPEENALNQFVLTIDAPFKEFYIYNVLGTPIENESLVPYADLDKYKYHLIGQNIREYTFGTHRRDLRWKHNVLTIWEDGESIESIPYEGSLLSLFPSRELLRAILEKTSKSIREAEIHVSFRTSEGKTLKFAIKDNPFRVKQEGHNVEITGRYKKSIDYNGPLKLLKMDDPSMQLDLYHDDEMGYVLPDKIKEWGKTLLIGRTRGRIYPGLVDISREWTPEERIDNAMNTPLILEHEFKSAGFNDPIWERTFSWFDQIHKDDIPASALFELQEVARNPETLLGLTFVKYALTDNDELPRLLEELKSFSADLAFSWYWLLPHLKSLMFVIERRIGEISLGNTVLMQIYMKWACQQGDKTMEYIGAMSNPDGYCQKVIQCLNETIESFKVWIRKLCEYSLTEQYDNKHSAITDSLVKNIASFYLDNRRKAIMPMETRGIIDYVEVSQDYISDKASQFFNQQKYIEPNKLGNELWMFKRVRAVADHFFQGVNLFEETEEIRRSIIFCRKACNTQFTIALNNKLAKGDL